MTPMGHEGPAVSDSWLDCNRGLKSLGEFTFSGHWVPSIIDAPYRPEGFAYFRLNEMMARSVSDHPGVTLKRWRGLARYQQRQKRGRR